MKLLTTYTHTPISTDYFYKQLELSDIGQQPDQYTIELIEQLELIEQQAAIDIGLFITDRQYNEQFIERERAEFLYTPIDDELPF